MTAKVGGFNSDGYRLNHQWLGSPQPQKTAL